MKNGHILILLLLKTSLVLAQDTFQLAPPILKYPSVFFKKEVPIVLQFAQLNTQIHYTLNGQEPTDRDPVYTRPILISKANTTLKARVFGKDFLPSETVAATFIKEGLAVKSIEGTLPNPKYAHGGLNILIDGQGGNTSFSAKTWLGFQSDTVELILSFNKKEKVKKVLVHLMQDLGSWIFLPEKIEVLYFDKVKNDFNVFGNLVFNQDKEAPSGFCTPSVIEASKAVKTEKIKLKLYLLKQIPTWHAGKGNKSWIFMDEIKVY